jgi:hypothetical protein
MALRWFLNFVQEEIIIEFASRRRWHELYWSCKFWYPFTYINCDDGQVLLCHLWVLIDLCWHSPCHKSIDRFLLAFIISWKCCCANVPFWFWSFTFWKWSTLDCWNKTVYCSQNALPLWVISNINEQITDTHIVRMFNLIDHWENALAGLSWLIPFKSINCNKQKWSFPYQQRQVQGRQ